MLELITGNRRTWQWAAGGKHPSVRDFFSIGKMFPLTVSFSEWLERGYSRLGHQTGGAHSFCSWRFWAKGAVPGHIVCGLVRDSSDSIGRPYPLLVMGSGNLEGWHTHWDLVPRVCDDTWAQMERFSVQGGNSVQHLEQALLSMQTPQPEWPSSAPEPRVEEEDDETPASEEFENFRSQLTDLSKEDAGYILLDSSNVHDSMHKIELVGRLLKQSVARSPSTVFIGGTGEASCFVFFRRPLKSADFSTLWLKLPQRQWMEER